LLKKYGLQAKKSWGQNFLVDERAYQRIVAAAGDDAWIVEIGAGLGTLTARLAERAPHVVAVERDRDMVAVLRGELGDNSRVEIAEANALTYDYAAVAARAGADIAVVGNLPYQIASQILFRLLDARVHVRRIVAMLQLEMVQRIVAKPSTPEYGALSVMLQMYGDVDVVCKVSRGCFLPAPRVDSAVLRLRLRDDKSTTAPSTNLDRFSRVVHAAFGQRRKTLRNALSTIAPREKLDEWLTRADIDGQRRGETLSVAEFARLAEEFDA
jgi:16S rRNA (adenine1518-N6/adenine1519-N6)-dimethyltransferase